MLIDVYPTAANIPADELEGRAAVVIDVLRATTTITQALSHGADTVVPVLSPEEAFQVVRDNPDRDFVLGGERKSVLIPGFHLSNSPLEYTEKRVSGRVVLFTTTNGTRAIRGAASAKHVFICSFLNAPAVARRLASLDVDVSICCAGTYDQFSLEDTACAGALVDMLTGPDANVHLNDLAHVSRDLYRQYKGRIAELLHLSTHGQNLLRIGLQEDLIHCAQFGALPLVPVFRDGQVTV